MENGNKPAVRVVFWNRGSQAETISVCPKRFAVSFKSLICGSGERMRTDFRKRSEADLPERKLCVFRARQRPEFLTVNVLTELIGHGKRGLTMKVVSENYKGSNTYGRAKWYERENKPYAEDYRIRNEYAAWIGQVDWKVFCTLTFAWRVNDQQATKAFDEFINRLERFLRSDVCYLRADDKRFSGCGKPACGRHFHVLMTSVTPMNAPLVESLWMSMAGNREDHAGAKVNPFNPNMAGVKYVMKAVYQPDGDFALRNFHLFHPEARCLQDLTGQRRRHLRRHSIRLKNFAATNSIQTSTKTAIVCTPNTA